MGQLVVVRVRVLSAARVVRLDTDNTLAALQAEVGDGLIELAGRQASRARPGVELDAWCNEDGHRLKLPPNRLVDGIRIVGDIVVSAADASTGDTLWTLDGELLAEALAWARSWPMIIGRIGEEGIA